MGDSSSANTITMGGTNTDFDEDHGPLHTANDALKDCSGAAAAAHHHENYRKSILGINSIDDNNNDDDKNEDRMRLPAESFFGEEELIWQQTFTSAFPTLDLFDNPNWNNNDNSDTGGTDTTQSDHDAFDEDNDNSDELQGFRRQVAWNALTSSESSLGATAVAHGLPQLVWQTIDSVQPWLDTAGASCGNDNANDGDNNNNNNNTPTFIAAIPKQMPHLRLVLRAARLTRAFGTVNSARKWWKNVQQKKQNQKTPLQEILAADVLFVWRASAAANSNDKKRNDAADALDAQSLSDMCRPGTIRAMVHDRLNVTGKKDDVDGGSSTTATNEWESIGRLSAGPIVVHLERKLPQPPPPTKQRIQPPLSVSSSLSLPALPVASGPVSPKSQSMRKNNYYPQGSPPLKKRIIELPPPPPTSSSTNNNIPAGVPSSNTCAVPLPRLGKKRFLDRRAEEEASFVSATSPSPPPLQYPSPPYLCESPPSIVLEKGDGRAVLPPPTTTTKNKKRQQQQGDSDDDGGEAEFDDSDLYAGVTTAAVAKAAAKAGTPSAAVSTATNSSLSPDTSDNDEEENPLGVVKPATKIKCIGTRPPPPPILEPPPLNAKDHPVLHLHSDACKALLEEMGGSVLAFPSELEGLLNEMGSSVPDNTKEVLYNRVSGKSSASVRYRMYDGSNLRQAFSHSNTRGEKRFLSRCSADIDLFDAVLRQFVWESKFCGSWQAAATMRYRFSVMYTDAQAKKQNAHIDYHWRDLDAKTAEQPMPYLGFLPLTKAGMFLQIWTGDPHDAHPKVGRIVFVPWGHLLVVPGNTVHGGGFRNGPHGNLRCHFYIHFGVLKVNANNTYTNRNGWDLSLTHWHSPAENLEAFGSAP